MLRNCRNGMAIRNTQKSSRVRFYGSRKPPAGETVLMVMGLHVIGAAEAEA